LCFPALDFFERKIVLIRHRWWDEEDFRKRGLERLIPERKLEEGEKWRVVEIVGAEVYPCGGTHVDTTKACGETKVKKISRSKGTSRVSYVVN
jgi:Ser-tRNA(Ala) deacylase AlaX